ncbi:indole-3-glycerol-phosphate synthase [Corynebacterium sanguinis]|nr:indole-3-glycerol-phosphate synthase [Corynebacterium sanguinis]MCT1412719.1 indole-3-glycerol-phosphate synthase [Corynebacterium sanguinis]MCT1424821.1 indole-3-glycerol-phosphate synthase [Corynebacterium sanguinis]MCT1444344.1 indole-3-glycerol-phosphate synthase [Corynebacterium sanguinis]MCT1462678.1 indole-3-glycerol-phosphate synthase [Corynebacterium sanguinis]MCT1491489.1 indole-3-glycerol-phosphate synthase [Corynebacterium sanguinis]
MHTAKVANGVVAAVLRDVEKREAVVPFQDIKARSREMEPTRDVRAALLRHGCGVIVEIKRNSPVFGPTAPFAQSETPVEDVARAIEAGGAHLIACQTERLRFDGSLTDMANARDAVDLPMVCRDVIVDPYQIHEARCFGADMIPLQVGILDQNRLEALIDRAESLGMVVMAEVRTGEEADRALCAGATVIAVNSWTFDTNSLNPAAFAEIAPGLPSAVIKISLGGVRTARDLIDAASSGADAVLAAEAVMSSDDVTAATRRLAAAGQHPACPSRS